jgi:energy-coupling factor transporter ATP-binding protein EcfA2
MLLRTVSIKNARTLEDVCLDELGQFNVLIGRNNAGKSSVLQVLAGVVHHVTGLTFGGAPDWSQIVTDRDYTRLIELQLVAEPSFEERRQFFDLLVGNGFSPTRTNELLASPFAAQVSASFTFGFQGRDSGFHFREARVQGEDVAETWPLVAQHSNRGAVVLSSFSSVLSGLGSEQANGVNVGIGGRFGGSFESPNWDLGNLGNEPIPTDTGWWPLVLLRRYLTGSYFFAPFRHSRLRMEVGQDDRLAPDGSNLPRVLSSMQANDEDRFNWIRGFVEQALPGVGQLITPMRGNETLVAFRAGAEPIPLANMGSGVEQLLFAAVVLSEPGARGLIALEEPESHLHPAAQRFLIDRLHEAKAQVFVTTHAPAFVDQSQSKRIFRIALVDKRSSVEPAGDTASLARALADVGVRNSDVLLADAVLFTEDENDYRVLATWAHALKIPFDKYRLAVIPMGGAEHAARHGPMRSEVLVRISQEAGSFPHLFVVDRDERTDEEVKKLGARIGEDRLHVWARRELENYLLAPRAILAGMRTKHQGEPANLALIGSVDEGELERRIAEIAAALDGLVLLKRIRARLGGFSDGVLARDDAEALSGSAWEPDLPLRVREMVDERLESMVSALQIDRVVAEEQERLKNEWEAPARRLELAPEEILRKVCNSLGPSIGFRKRDVALIARQMHPDEISNEVQLVVHRLAGLTERGH